jgi:hypothetical protein
VTVADTDADTDSGDKDTGAFKDDADGGSSVMGEIFMTLKSIYTR